MNKNLSVFLLPGLNKYYRPADNYLPWTDVYLSALSFNFYQVELYIFYLLLLHNNTRSSFEYFVPNIFAFERYLLPSLFQYKHEKKKKFFKLCALALHKKCIRI